MVASGSLPRGVPEDFYAQVAAIAARRGQRFVLDTSGAPLRAAVGGDQKTPIALIKPSRGEFAGLTGAALEAPGALEKAALGLVRQGRIGLLAVTLGHEGALLAEPSGVLRLPALDVPVLGAVGAGDSFLAAMVLALARGEAPREAFAWGMAAGAAAVMRAGTAHPRREDVVALRQRIGPV